MKILHIINSLNTGGAEKLIVETLPLINSNGFDVDLALLDGTETPFYQQLLKSAPNLQIVKLSTGSVYSPLLIFKLIPILKKYSLVHVHLFPAQYWVVIAKLLSNSKTKFLFTEHSTANRRLNNRFWYPLDKFIYGNYTKIIGISPKVLEVLNRKLHISYHKMCVISNGINMDNIRDTTPASREEFGYEASDVILIMVAGFRREKDHKTVIDCLKYLPVKYKLLLVGDGEMRSEIEGYTGSLKCAERVKFLGIRSDVYSLMKMSDISILSSHWEGFGLAAAESMACGIPTIASDVEGLNEVVAGGGLLFKKGDAKALVDIVLKLENKDFYENIAEKGFIKAKEYSIYNMVSKTINLYHKIIGN